jgi:hypothetical protein
MLKAAYLPCLHCLPYVLQGALQCVLSGYHFCHAVVRSLHLEGGWHVPAAEESTQNGHGGLSYIFVKALSVIYHPVHVL